jgi:hypothetical protein
MSNVFTDSSSSNYGEILSYCVLSPMVPKSIEIKVASVNIRSVVVNSEYLTELAFNHHVVYFCEGFNESAGVVLDSILLENKVVYTDPAVRKLGDYSSQQDTADPSLPNKIKKKKGRLSNGSGFVVSDDINCEYFIHTKRISYLQINKLIIIGCYFPYMGGNTPELRSSNEHEYSKTVSDLNELIEVLSDGVVEFIILGDFNTDFKKMEFRTNQLIGMLAKNSLTCADVTTVQPVDYTYFKIIDGRFISSWIDHMFIEEFMANLIDCSINTSTNNMGDHNALSIEYKVDLCELLKPVNKKQKKKKKVPWHDVDMQNEYKSRTEIELNKLKDLKNDIIQEEFNIKEILTTGINELNAAFKRSEIKSHNVVKNNIKQKKKAKKKQFAGSYCKKYKSWWDDTCSALFKRMIDAYKQFINSGYNLGDYEFFKSCKSDFNRQKKYSKKLRRNKQLRHLNDLFKLDREAFWRRIKSMSKNNKKTTVKIDKLKEHFEKLFTQRNEENKKEEEANQRIEDDFLKKYESTTFNIDLNKLDIEESIKQLKNGKSQGTHGVCNENFKYALCDELVDFIHVIFTKMINNKIMPNDFNVCIIKPLLKDLTKSANDISNTRPVAISNVLPNIFETILLIHVNKDHKESEYQCGFKSNSSCNHAGFILRECMNVAKQKNKKLYMVAIDASKAFDKVCRLALWSKLIKSSIDPAIVYSLMQYYNESYMLIMNQDEMSSLFRTRVGVRQGGVVSPKLFNIYIEDIINLVNESCEPGVQMGNLNIKVILYADDIIVLSHTKRGLGKLLKIVEQFGSDKEIKFNPEKTYYMLHNEKAKVSKIIKTSERIQPDPELNGINIDRVSEMRYLGLELNDLNRNNSHIKKRKAMSYACLSKIFANNIYCKFETSPRQIVQLYRTYIRPILFYGNENFDFNLTERNKLVTIDGNIMKNMLGVPVQCHTTDLQIACGMDTAEQYMSNCKAKFIKRLSENSLTSKILRYTIENRVPNSLSTHFFNNFCISEGDRTYERILSLSNEEILKFKLLKNERKNLKIELNEKVAKIRKLLDSYENINFQSELFNIIKHD